MKRFELTEYRNVGSVDDLPPDESVQIAECITSAFAGGIRADDARAHMSGGQVLVAREVLEDGQVGEVAGFTSTSIISPYDLFALEGLSRNRAAYFAGAAIAAQYQGQGLYSQLFSARIRYAFESEVDTIYTRTQNPRVFRGLESGVRGLVEARIIRDYVVGQQICRSAYYGRLMQNMPEEFEDLDTDAGDAKIFTWSFTLPD